MKNLATLAVVFTVWFLFVLGCAAGHSNQPHKIIYDVVGNGTSKASVTYSRPDGGTEQAEAILPWSQNFTAQDGDFLYLSAQNKNSEGSVTVYITIDGDPRKQATSSGGYVIATTKTRCCG